MRHKRFPAYREDMQKKMPSVAVRIFSNHLLPEANNYNSRLAKILNPKSITAPLIAAIFLLFCLLIDISSVDKSNTTKKDYGFFSDCL
jgi:hypothetical protein